MRRRAFLFVLFVSVFVVGGEAVAMAWRPPVTGPVVDQWRPPEHIYGSGNRGVDFAPSPDTPVVAAGPGVVNFAGQVGGVLYVVVGHEGGVKTTYGDLASAAVVVGQPVTAGQVVGKAGARLHFGVRVDGVYVDPNSLFGRPQLVPTEDGDG